MDTTEGAERSHSREPSKRKRSDQDSNRPSSKNATPTPGESSSKGQKDTKTIGNYQLGKTISAFTRK
jgi:hypothetical protein